MLAEDPCDLPARPNGHCRLGNDDRKPIGRCWLGGKGAGDRFGRAMDIAHQDGSAAVRICGRADGYKEDVDVGRCRLVNAGGEAEVASRYILSDDFLEARLENRDLTRIQSPDLQFVSVDADNTVPEFRKAGARHKSDIARPNYADVQHCDDPLD